MTTRARSALLLALALAACSSHTNSPTAPSGLDGITATQGKAKVDPGYTAYVSGSTTDVQTTPAGGALLAGGGTDSDAGMQWLLAQGGARSAGKYGDVVVLRTSGTNGYNRYLVNFGANSVTSIVISTVAGANSDYVRDAIAKAEVVFIAGGDQSTYVNLWTGTALQSAVNARVAAGYPIGGTSAGLAVLSPFVYAAFNVSSTSAIVLANPYDASVTITNALFNVPVLQNLITDSHFVTRDRMGRLVTFLARLQQDGRSSAPRGIGVDEQSAIGVSATGAATAFGAGNGAYLLSVPSNTTRVCSANTPLTFTPVTTVRVPVGAQFNLTAWTTSSVSYVLSANAGVLSSSVGTIY
ncbi:cyanophycinase [Gemmatimonas groenlandica]|uniref:Cyanophycinase n=1 Tax=Gemmatimonas groenlandica TaxID=2732249 RepID=A0A6M4IMW9_9BACT|nr:cyanophycinase [Gemmatimonas groenlandica]QJR34777.1 cyanophycinase [Gemmatimonas groenlandica]